MRITPDGAFPGLFSEYIDYKRNLGYVYPHSRLYLVRRLSRSLAERATDRRVLTRDAAEGFAQPLAKGDAFVVDLSRRTNLATGTPREPHAWEQARAVPIRACGRATSVAWAAQDEVPSQRSLQARSLVVMPAVHRVVAPLVERSRLRLKLSMPPRVADR